MDLRGIHIIVNHSEGTPRVTGLTRRWFGGDPNYHCEEATPREVSRICRENPRLRIPAA